MTRMIDFSQGEVVPSGSPYHVAIQGQAFFQVKEANGTTTYTRNTAPSRSTPRASSSPPTARKCSARAARRSHSPHRWVRSRSGRTAASRPADIPTGKLGLVHFDSPSTRAANPASTAASPRPRGSAKQGLAANDQVMQGKLEESNSNPVTEMANMIQAVRLYEANQKTVQAADDNQNQLINSLGSRPQA